MCRILPVVAIGWIGLWVTSLQSADVAPRAKYADLILMDKPVVGWSFSEVDGQSTQSLAGTAANLPGKLAGGARLGAEGPRPQEYPLFDEHNLALVLSGAKSFVRVADPGDNSPLDFQNGDVITLEAWVSPESLAEGQNMYIVGKGRTNNDGYPRENQNYALRLVGASGLAHVSFLFRSLDGGPEGKPDYHRWTSAVGFVVDGGWHHVVVAYQFGEPDNVRGYVDGAPSQGTWDMAGATTAAPVVDNDELWIGSALGGSASNTFLGRLDEVAIYRSLAEDENVQARFAVQRPDPRATELAAAADLPRDTVTAEIYEKLPNGISWSLNLGQPVLQFAQPALAFVGAPKKYTATGVIADRSNPYLLRGRCKLNVPPESSGDYQFLLRAKNAARLYVDGQLVANTSFLNYNSDGHEPVPELSASARPDLRALPPGCQEQLATVKLEPGEHVVRLDTQVGGKSLRLEVDDVCVAIARPDESFHILSANPDARLPLTDEGWEQYKLELTALLTDLDRRHRQAAAADWRRYWEERHAVARYIVEQSPPLSIPELPAGLPAHNAIDHFIGAKLAESQIAPAPLTDDYAFARRAALDTVGIVPTPRSLAEFLADESIDRRARYIDRLLDDAGWADHWVAYWQDVLAENPGILKPELNNTGPFRWWIYESFRDNKPLDRFVTELVMMEGSKYYGGPAGFGMATQNDMPAADKAHVLAKAFLAMDLTCARCHDAPYHPFKQRELFSLAAMLDRKTLELPKSSTVPIREGGRKPLVEITLQPGDKIDPNWPFSAVSDAPTIAGLPQVDQDPRARLAAMLTTAHNQRFAQVIVNRVWRRYLGRGLIEPVDDWESVQGQASHPELLEYLAQQFIVSGYDLKHVARLILNSHAYQRQVTAVAQEHPHLFAAPLRRRMSAEQLADSLLSVTGKAYDAELLTLDPEGRRPVDTFLNLGQPERAWQFTSLSNERDRPALALPVSQSIVDLLLAYGWRDARPNPLTVRDETPTVLQPMTLANGIAGARAVRLSDDSELTGLCVEAATPRELVEQLFVRVVGRQPSAEETALFAAELEPGFAERHTGISVPAKQSQRRNAVSWSNHLSAEATKIKQELERAVLAGDPPSVRLATAWRERAEDVVWALFNTPEFVFVP